MEIAMTPTSGMADLEERLAEARWGHPEPPDDSGAEPRPKHFEFIPGDRFVLDAPERPTAVWGRGEGVLWADGESLMIASLQGLGKTTVGQQLALGRCGIPEYADLFGLPVAAGQGRVLYLAMDRPGQARRSFRRMVGEAFRGELAERLIVWQGPPPLDLAKWPRLMLEMAEAAEADTVIVDSLKDAFIGLNDDEAAAGWNRARQTLVRDGVQLLELHHLRKPPTGARAEAPSVSDVYGSTWLTSGCGSVVMLTGKPGDPVVGLHHVKQPAAEVGPFQVIHDHDAGRSTVWNAVDLAAVVKARGAITAVDAAAILYDTSKPSPAEKQKARRKLDHLTQEGRLVVLDEGDQASNRPRLWGTR